MAPSLLMLIALVGAHCFLDYAGQGDFMAKAKNMASPVPNVPAWLVLWSHGAIHGAAAALITGLPAIFIGETVFHALTDDRKCRGRISYVHDQVIHLGCKVVWFLCALGAS